jgi:hypothetical protein
MVDMPDMGKLSQMLGMQLEEEGDDDYTAEDVAFAMVERGKVGGDYSGGPPRGDYQEENPYGDGEHGGYESGDEERMGFMEAAAGSKFDLPIRRDPLEDEDDRDALIEEDMEVADRSKDFQGLMDDDEDEDLMGY